MNRDVSSTSSYPISVGLVDDQALVRAGFAMLIDSQDDMHVLWQAGDGAQVPGMPHADIVLMDVQMPMVDGITATKGLLARDAEVKVIMLTTFNDRSFITGAIAAGASGFLLKDAMPEDLLSAIRVVNTGEAILAPRETAQLLWSLHSSTEDQGFGHSGDIEVLDTLTRRELGILRLIALGLTNEEIASTEYVSMATVKTHVRHIFLKTSSRDRVHAVLFAYRTGVVTKEELLGHH